MGGLSDRWEEKVRLSTHERLSAAVGEDERGCSELSSMATLVDKEMLGY